MHSKFIDLLRSSEKSSDCINETEIKGLSSSTFEKKLSVHNVNELYELNSDRINKNMLNYSGYPTKMIVTGSWISPKILEFMERTPSGIKITTWNLTKNIETTLILSNNLVKLMK